MSKLSDDPRIDPRLKAMPDGNTIQVQFIRPDGVERPACVYYLHGGGMATMSCFDGHYRAWGRIIASQGVAVAMVDFRNSVAPSSHRADPRALRLVPLPSRALAERRQPLLG
jgi:acetyl esterase/lipase